MTQPTPPRPSHQVRLEVDILTDEFAVPQQPSAMVLLVGAAPAVRDAVSEVLALHPDHARYDAPTFLAMMERVLRDRPELERALRALLG